MKQIFAKESRIECAVVLKSLRDDVISSSHYDPSDPLKNVVLSGVEQELLNSKEILAKRAELLESRIGDVFVKSNENKELTLASRFDKLNSIIKDYYNSDPIVRAYVGPYLNRAIDSINDEFMPVNHEAEQNMVENIKEVSEKLCTVSADAKTEILALLDRYKDLDPATAKAVLPNIQKLYKSYLKNTTDDAEVKGEVSKAYYAIPKTFSRNLSFDISKLYVEDTNNNIESDFCKQIELMELNKVKYEDLVKIVNQFTGIDLIGKASAFGTVLFFLEEYCELHPNSNAADALKKTFSETYYELVRMEGHINIVDSCRLLNATTTAFSRNENLGLARDILSDFENLSGIDRELVRPVVIDAIEKFNNFALKHVIIPDIRVEEKEENNTDEIKFSYQYYAVLQELEDHSKEDYSDAINRAKELTREEQNALIKETDNELAQIAISNHLSSYKLITGKEKVDSAKTLIQAFLSLSGSFVLDSFGNFMKKFSAAEQDKQESLCIENVYERILDGFITYTENFYEQNTTDIINSISFVKELPNEWQQTFLEHVIAYYESFVYCFPKLAVKVNKVVREYVETVGSVDDISKVQNIANSVSEEVQYLKTVAKVREIASAPEKISEDSYADMISLYVSLREPQMKELYLIVRSCISQIGRKSKEFNEATLSAPFNALRFLGDIKEEKPEKMDAGDMINYMDRMSSFDSADAAVVVEDVYRLYENFADNHPRMIEYPELEKSFENLCNIHSNFAYKVAANYGLDYILPMQLSGLKSSFIVKAFDKFDSLPLSVKDNCVRAIYEIYEEYKYGRNKIPAYVTDKFNQVFGAFIQEAISAGRCRREFAEIATNIIYADKTIENYERFIREGSTKSVEQGGYMISHAHSYEKALFNICYHIEKDLEDRAHILYLKDQFAKELEHFKVGLKLRQSLASARDVQKISEVTKSMLHANANASIYAGNMYAAKMEKFLTSSKAEYRYDIIVKEGSNETRYMIERVVNPFCLIASRGGSKYAIATDRRIELNVNRDNIDLYAALVGRTVIRANNALNEQMRFAFNRNGRPIMILKSPVNVLADYEPGDTLVEYPVKAIVPEGIKTVVIVKEPDTYETIEIVTGIKPRDILNRMRADVIIDSSNRAFVRCATDVLSRYAEKAVAYQKNSIKALTVLGMHKDIDNEIEITPETFGLRIQNGILEAVIDSKSYVVVSINTVDADETKIVIEDDEGKHFSFTCDGIFSDIIEEVFDETITEAEHKIDLDADIISYGADVCLKQIRNGNVVFTPIFDIRFSETGAIVDLISVKGNESIQIGYSYEEAIKIFASNFRNSAYCRQISMSDLEFEKINGVIVVKNSVYAETFDVIAIVDNQIYAANESGFALIKANNILDQIKIGNKIVTCFRDDNGTPIYKVGTGTNSEDAILTDLPLRNVKINRNLMESLTENDGAAVTGIKVVPMDNDLSRVSILFKDGDVRVKGIDKDRSKIEIVDPVIKFNSNGELFVCGLDSMENICQYRIIGTAFGEFDNLLARVSC